jgi:tetratricopeptide (TPR) repeat protein
MDVTEALSLEAILSDAGKKEKEYDWLGAMGFLKKALALVHEQDRSIASDIYERSGYASYRAAMQSENVNEFRERMSLAIVNYRKAREFYGSLNEQEKKPRMLRCDAMIAYLGFWLASEVSEKKRLLDECWKATREALDSFEEAGDAPEFGKTFNQLSSSAYQKYVLEWNTQAGEKILREAVERGEKAVTLLSSVCDSYELARACVKTAQFLTGYAYYFVPDMDDKESCFEKSLGYWHKAIELSEEAALLELLSINDTIMLSVDEILVHYNRALVYAKKTGDKYMIGSALDILTYAYAWKSIGAYDPDKRVELAQKALQCAEEAEHQFSFVHFISPRGGVLWTGAPYAEQHLHFAEYETDLSRRRYLLEKAVAYGIDAVKLAESTGYHTISDAHHVLSKALVSLARIETNTDEKKKLLEKAMESRMISIRMIEQVQPFTYWNLGVMWNYSADLKAELSNFEKDSERKMNMLEEAISDKERSLQFCIKENSYWEKRSELSYFAAFGNFQYSYGELLNRLYELTNNPEYQSGAIKAFEEAAESFQKLDLISRVAECHWKVARGYDVIGEHLKAIESFVLASESYTKAVKKIPQLRDIYQDYALYMQSWSEIEKARHHHRREEYSSAKECYEKATNMHKSSKKWSYLATNYSAWAQVENAEHLSREEKTREAIQAFQEAAKLFKETKNLLQIELDKIENLDEKQMVTNLINATDLRREYCIGRIALEEAKDLDKKGEHYSSSEKYGSGAKIFEKITQALESEQDRNELKLIATLSRAWQKMTRAEAEASPTFYTEASQLFEEAKELSPHDKGKMLALGHSRFCTALDAGTKFADTRDIKLHATAIQHLETAANYYIKAGFQGASEYAKATELLLDAYMHMDTAKKEKDPEKKARLYAMAEKVLRVSAGSYNKAEHPEKKEQVLRLLQKVKEERELALSLSDILHAPTIFSTTATFAAPTPTHEKAVGLERFEHADIQARLTASEEVTVGEEFDVRLDLVNAGKNFALLVRVDGLIPPGLKVTSLHPQVTIENNSLDMKGKRLDPLKVESIKLSMQPTEPVVINLNPQVIFVDDAGKFGTSKPEPVRITVHPKLAFEFKAKAAQGVFDFLLDSFVEDYMKRRISLEQSGWRTLMEIVKRGKVPRSSVYGVGGRLGLAVSELERRGLVETRVFPGERGRGGRILKARIFYEKETIKRCIDKQIMKNNEK